MFFFFQAEDGIRDLVRSRGLGDVYKRQGQMGVVAEKDQRQRNLSRQESVGIGERQQQHLDAVSYTHLTLPTSDLV